MAVSVTSFKARLLTEWAVQNTITGFRTATAQDSLQADISPTVSAGALNRMYYVQSTLAAAASVTINVYALTEPIFGTSIVPVRAYTLQLYGTGSSWKLEPGAADPLSWFLSGTTPAVSGGAGSAFMFADATAATVSNTAKNIKITNTGGSTLTYNLALGLGV